MKLRGYLRYFTAMMLVIVATSLFIPMSADAQTVQVDVPDIEAQMDDLAGVVCTTPVDCSKKVFRREEILCGILRTPI